MKNIINFLLLFTLSGILGCSTNSPLVPETEFVVVRAYLYANEPVQDIQLTSTLSLDSDSTAAPPINDAQVALINNGQRYELELSPGDSGYYHYSGNDLSVETGDLFTLEVAYSDKLITGETIVPEAPDNVSISTGTLILPDFSNFGPGNRPNLDSLFVTVNWQNDNNELFYVVLDNVDPNPQPVDTRFPVKFSRFISRPIRTDTYRINGMTVTHLGKHRVKVYRVNQEYADLYESREQDSRDLNEPLTNIKNGLGIFSAFNSASLLLNIKQE